MNRSTFRARAARILMTAGLAFAALGPATAPVAAAEPVVLRVGTTQDLDSLNPYATLLVVGYEAFQLTYNLLVDFGPDLEPVAGFADSWERAADGQSWTFHIREGMKWSDGEPATSADACFSWQFAIDSIAENGSGYLGAGYIDPGVEEAGVTKVECPDANTMIATTDDASLRILQTYMPIIPKHIWGAETYATIGEAVFDAPLIGTGPYTAVEWQTGQFLRLQRNPNYWGTQGYADEVDIIIYKTADSMAQALKAGEVDYVRGVNADQLNALKSDPNIQTVAGSANGWTQLAFNTYGTGTGKTIKGGGPSTPALLDAAFRDALGYAVDKQTLVDRVLGGYGDLGDTIVPPVQTQWHVTPDKPRTFDIELAKQKLDAAGYKLDGSGNRLDKENNPITLRMYMPDSDDNYPKAAQFIADWYGQLGIKVTTQVLDSGTLGELVLPPEAGDGYTADYDIELWGWSWNVDPSGELQIFKCDAIGSSSDSQYCNPAFDKLYDDQLAAPTIEARKAIIAQMQNLIYDEAVYDVLYYDSNLDAYRTDRFAGWQNQPTANGTPMFTYGVLGYTRLTNAALVPTAAPATEAPGGATPAPSAAPGDSGAGSGDSTPLVLGGLVVVVVVVGYYLWRRRQGAGGTMKDEGEE
ncbi:MAG: ABC transporter substrate-binding protein [Candidatus Limnocylindrales bacterium]